MPAKTWPRNVAPMHEANRRRWDRIKIQEARALLEKHGYRVIEPEPGKPVKATGE